ncbi:MAG: hypothetical protein IKR11_00820, partial [Solobacterium sp.]|nr:hypothetical protein [Solobacterium sp.]
SEYLNGGEYQEMARKVLGAAVAGNRKAYEELKKRGETDNMKEDLRFVFEEEFADYDKQLKEKDASLKEKDATLKEKDASLKEKDASLKEKDEAINNFIKMLSDSLGMETLKSKILQSNNQAMLAEFNKIMRTL